MTTLAPVAPLEDRMRGVLACDRLLAFLGGCCGKAAA